MLVFTHPVFIQAGIMRFEWLVPAYIRSLYKSSTSTWYDSHISFTFGQKMFRGILNVALLCIPNKQASRKTQCSINFIKPCVCEIFVHPAIFTKGTNYPGNLVKFLILPLFFEYNEWWQLSSIGFCRQHNSDSHLLMACALKRCSFVANKVDCCLSWHV